MNKIRKVADFLSNMGPRYLIFRTFFEISRKTGLLKRRFPTSVPTKKWVDLEGWKQQPIQFFFENKESLTIPKSDETAEELSHDAEKIKQGYIQFFSSTWLKVSDWHTNADTDHRYNPTQHWTEISDFQPSAGDIKYVWEKSRFSFLYPLIRYDYHAQRDQSEYVFSEIESWIDSNPTNQGPNWWCSQEMSLRVLNWTFALHYYKNTSALSEKRFQKIINAIYWQLKHVEANINFSRIAVRNNHAISETLCLYLGGLLYPFFEEASSWKQKGKQWFEQEIAYQIYEDGTFLQFSMNYHRVVIQLLTWGIVLAEKNNERWSEVVYERANKSLLFLQTCQDNSTGWLPNYGNNDGAIFFKLNNNHYRDYRPQLEALSTALGQTNNQFEDSEWYNSLPRFTEERTVSPAGRGEEVKSQKNTSHIIHHTFKDSGYYIHKDQQSLTFLRCGKYKDRPFQADNLHLDIWVNGENLLRDAGSYKYNTDEKWVKYFAGTASHNTVMLGDYDQMQKGPFFVWYNWIKQASASLTEQDNEIVFDGKAQVFGQVGKNIWHRRRVSKIKEKLHWSIEDWIENAPRNLPIHQIWHPSEYCLENYGFECFQKNGNTVSPIRSDGWYSSLYGQKELTPRLIFSSDSHYLKTVFSEKVINR